MVTMTTSRSVLSSVAIVVLGFCLVYMMARIMTLHRRMTELEMEHDEQAGERCPHSVSQVNKLIRTQLEAAIRDALQEDEKHININNAKPRTCTTARMPFAAAVLNFPPVTGFVGGTTKRVSELAKITEVSDSENDAGVEESKQGHTEPVAAVTSAAPSATDLPDPDVSLRSKTDEGDGTFTPPPADIDETESQPAQQTEPVEETNPAEPSEEKAAAPIKKRGSRVGRATRRS